MRRVRRSDEDRIADRAAALVEELQLSPERGQSLLSILLQEQSQRAAAFSELRSSPDQAAARARVRAELDAIRAWKTRTLRDQFGADHASRILRRRFIAVACGF